MNEIWSVIKNFFISKSVQDMCSDMIENFDQWSVKHCRFIRNDGMSIWIGNGVFFIDVGSGGLGLFNLIEKYYILKFIKKSIIKKSCSTIKPTPTVD